ncbi:MAG: CPBP family intramembrane metalloprotease [Planctomycetes bacterium]|nr:CPBP family intramembrane metalloprotease [Planctomycetota bacterium]
MSGAVTLVLGLLLLGYLFVASLTIPTLGRAAAFEGAPDSVARAFDRRLELAAALEDLPEWERAALAPFVPAGAHTAEEALAAFRGVIEGARARRADDGAEPEVRAAQLDTLRARRVVLLAERGRLEEAQGDLDELARAGHAAFVAAARALARGEARLADLALAGEGWIGRTARARAGGEERPAPGERTLAALRVARATALLVVVGLTALLAWLVRGRPPIVAGALAIPAPWTPQTGFGVLVRAAFLAVVVSVAFGVWIERSGAQLLWAPAVLLASAPLLVLARRHLASPIGIGAGELLGGPIALPTAALAALGLFALERLGGGALRNAALALGASDPWVFEVGDLSASDAAFWWTALAGVVAGVLAQTLAFAGILFPSLRHVHGPVHAAVLTGLLYSAIQTTSFPRMLALAWAGVAYALSAERTRSLIPALLAAATGFALDQAFFALLYR